MKSIHPKLFLTILLFWGMTCSLCYGQSTFYQTYDYGYREKAYAMQATYDGGYIMSGFLGIGIGINKILVIKVDSLGNEEWHKFYGGNWANTSWSVIPLEDGGYIVGAETSGDEPNSSTYLDIYLLRLDALGDTLWTKTLYTDNGAEYFQDMELCPDGGYIITGCKASLGESCDAYILKVDSLGNKEWDKTYQSSTSIYKVDIFYEVEVLPDSGFIFGGRTETTDSLIDVFVLRTNANGEEIWINTYGWYQSDFAREMILEEEAVVLAGGTASFSGFIPDLLLLKINLDGDTIWTKVIDTGEKELSANTISLAQNGDYLISVWNSNNQPQSSGDVDLIRMSPQGEVLWWRQLLNSTELEKSHDLLQNPDGSIVLAGQTSDGCAGCAFLMKITEDGYLSATYNNIKPPATSFLAYPNPTDGILEIKLSREYIGDINEIQIYDLLGNLTKRYPINFKDQTSPIDLSSLPKGVFFLLLKNTMGEILARETIVKIE